MTRTIVRRMRRSTGVAAGLGALWCATVFLAGMAPGQSAEQQGPPPPPGAEEAAPPGQLPPLEPPTPSEEPPQAAEPPPADGQPPAEVQQTEQPIFRTGINFVRVDVIVTDDDGNPVPDLAAEDFQIREDGEPQTIETFRAIRVTGAPEPGGEPAREIRSDYVEEMEAARDDVRMFAVFLDDYHVRDRTSLSVREPLQDFLLNQLGPLDLVGIMYPLTPASDVRFTRNREALASAVGDFLGRKYEYEPRNEFERNYSHYSTDIVERIRNEVSLSALRALVTRMGGLREGRKTIIVVSEGYSNYVPPALRSSNAQFMDPRQRGAGMSPMPDPNEERIQWISDMDIQEELRRLYDAANRSNAALYTLDPRGLTAFESDLDAPASFEIDRNMLNSTQDSLRVLAEQTDGRAIVNRNDLEAGLQQAVRDASFYYLIGYSSTEAPDDGRYHEIEVEVLRPDVQVRARRGYWAPTAEDVERATAVAEGRGLAPEVDAEITDALAAIERPTRAQLVRTWIGASPGDNGKTRVTFVWEPVESDGTGRRAARVSVVAMGEDGPAYFRGDVPGSDAPAGTGGSAGFDAAPGTVQLRLSVEGDVGEVLDTDIRTVEVPDFTAPDALVSSPWLVRSSTVRELRTQREDPEAIPAAGREFRRTERLLVRFAARGPGDTVPETTVRLLNRGGGEITPLEVEPVAGGTSAVQQALLQLASIPPGDYLIEVTAKTADSSARELLAFRVVG